MGIKVRHNGQWVEMGFAGAPGGEPVGTIIAWGGSAANIPSNFRLCDGQALSRTTYSDLFSKLGTIHGSGDGSTTFNIPDLRSRFIVGANNVTGEGSWPSVGVGSTGGNSESTLPSHRHNFPGDDHLAFANGVAGWNTNTNGTFSMDADSSSSGAGKMWYTTYAGSTDTNTNLPPYYALCYIIKIDTSSATGSGVADGDYGDITVSNSGTVWNIDQDTIGPTELIATGVSAGTYTNPSITVDEDGRLTAASSGSAPVTTFLGLSDTPSTYVPSAGKVLVVNSTQNGVEFVDKSTITSGLFQDKISEGDSKAEIIDTATESKLTVEIDSTEKVSISTAGPRIHRQDSSLEGGSISFTRAADDILAFEIDVYGPSSSNSNRFRIVDQSISGGVERFAIGPNGEIGLGYVSNTSADYGTAGQVLTSGGPGVGATWADASGGVGSSDPVGTIVAWAGSVGSIPSEYQLCDGGAAATSELQAITGTNVPDLRDRFVVGAGSGYSPGNTGGANTVTLTLNQIPAHNHFDTATNGGAGPSQWGFDVDGNGSSGRVLVDDGPPWNGIVGNLSRGGGQAHENRPPYYALCYIIKHTAISGSGGGSAGDKISEGDTEAEVVDTGFDGHFKVTTEGTERLRVTSNGSVGIGTTNPEGGLNPNPLFGTKLDVFKSFVGGGDRSFVGRFYGLDTNVQETSVRFVTKGTGGTAADLHNASDAYLMHGISNGYTKFVFGANGNVGIGSTIPREKIDISAGRIILDQDYQFTWANGTTNRVRIYGDSGDNFVVENGSSNTERLRIGSAGQIGLGGANYGTPGQVLVSAGANAAPSWQNGSNITGFTTDKISEGNTEAEVVDTGSDGHFKVTTEGTERLRVTHQGIINMGRALTDDPVLATGNVNAGLKLLGATSSSSEGDGFGLVANAKSIVGIFNRTNTTGRIVEYKYNGSVVGAIESDANNILEILGENATKFKVAGNEKLRIGPAGQIGLGGANYGTSGQVLTSNGSSSAPTWQDASGGGGSSDPVGTIVAWAGSVGSIPSEYQLCDGSAAATSELQAITGANVPNLRNKFIVGANNSTGDTTYPGLSPGATGGSADAVVVQHNHGITEPNSGQGHRHVYTAATSIGGYTDDGGSPDQRSTTKNNLNTNYSTTGITIDNEGVSGTNANLPPYYALCYIIKHTATSGSGSGSGSGFVLLARKSATGTSVEFTGIPANALEITLMFEAVSGSTGADFDVQLGTSGGYITSNYNSSSEQAGGDANSISTSSFVIRNQNSSRSFHGSMIINKSSSNSYSQIGQFKKSSDGAVDCYGSLSSVSGVVDRLKVSIGNGNFDAGLIGLSYKTSGSGGGSAGDKISEGDSKAEIIDTATESKFTVEIDATEKFSVDIAGPKIHRQDSSNEGGSLIFNRAADDVAAFELDVYGSSSSNSGVFRIIDATGGGERFLIGPNGEIGLSGANYGSSGQVLTSNGSGSTPTWQTVSGGGGGGTVSSGTFTATAGSPSTLESYTYNSAELVFEYTVFVKNGSNYQTQKLLVMRDGTTVDSSQYAVMYNSNLLVQLDATISGGNVNLRATPETGVSGSTTYRIKREVV